jgi:hypothetical protein
MMFKKTKPAVISTNGVTFPHCDIRILHSPGECEHCDNHKDWQMLRQVWGIAFTGWTPDEKELPCPADHARGDVHTLWRGNQARKKGYDIIDTEEKKEPTNGWFPSS